VSDVFLPAPGQPVPILFERLHSSAKLPTRATEHSAAFDIYAISPGYVEPGERISVSTGLQPQIPPGWVGILAARSGWAHRYQVHLANGIGVIDADFPGELVVMLEMTGIGSPEREEGEITSFARELCGFQFGPYERIAQILFLPLPPVIVGWADGPRGQISERIGGLGSTGSL
jgi:dUTP pyrophosphatase